MKHVQVGACLSRACIPLDGGLERHVPAVCL